ncbi:MAG: T9SS type A sorting domain-containing protein, partial [Prolixibacteraceae bacterium]
GEEVDAKGCSQSQLDDDGDGVNNNIDECLNTPLGEEVDDKGCEAMYTIEGYITYQQANKSKTDENLSGIQILLIHNNLVVETAYTDSMGYYIFYVFSEGEYSIEIKLDGYSQTTVINVMVNKEEPSIDGVNFILWDDGTITNIDIIRNDIFFIYPNPTTDILYLECSSNGRILVFNTKGKMVHQQLIEDVRTEINVSGFISGIYLIKFESNTGAGTSLFRKQ